MRELQASASEQLN